MWRRRSVAPAVSVSVTAVQRGTVRDYVTSSAAGRVSARMESTLRADIVGTVKVLHKHRGDKVKAGEAIVTYDAEELGERLRLAQSAVAIAQAQSKQAQENGAVIETNLARAQRLKATGAIADVEVENLTGQSLVAARALEGTQAGISQAYANVELARTALAKAVVRAPFAGTVISTAVEVGETTAPGAVICQLADTSALHVDAELDEADIGRVAVGMPVDVTLDAFPGERIRGKLTEVAPSVSRDPRGGRSVNVDVALPQDPRLRVGMSADVDVIVSTRENVLFVSPNAVVGRGTDRSVYQVTDGIAHLRKVDVGVSTWEAVEIKGGLAEKDQVVSSLSSSKMQDNVPVTINAEKPAVTK
jgi:HlyD family secretion protein